VRLAGITTDDVRTAIINANPLGAERTIADRLTRLANGTLPWPWIDPDKALPWVEKHIGLALAESQVAAVRLALMSKVTVMTGGPGVGKTTIVKAILRILAAKGIEILLCAPTGRAAKRMTEATGMEAKTIHRTAGGRPQRRHFLRLTSMAAASALAPTVLWAEQREATDSATSQAESARIATFEEVWRTVRDRFYDPHLHGLDWSAVREHYLPGATWASSEEAVAGVINSMLSELHASHTRYYTPEGPEYYQLSDIFAGALRRRGLERAFPGGRISYPGVGVLSRVDMQGRSVITGVIQGTPAEQAGLLAGDEIVFADGAPFQPVQSFRGKVGREVVLGLRRAGAFMQISVTPVDIEPNKMFLDGLKASARIIRANGRSIGYVHVWCYAGSVYQRTLEHLLSQSPLNDADALIWDLRDGWGGAIPEYLDLFNTRAPTMQVTDRNAASELASVVQGRHPPPSQPRISHSH
jgi:carboxyl-terminal processing protease